MSGTYSDPKGHERHVPGKVDHAPDPSKDVLVDGNGSPTKIGTETLMNGDPGEDTRGVGQENISAKPVGGPDKSEPIEADRGPRRVSALARQGRQHIIDRRQATGLQEGDPNNKPATSNVREQRQYPEGNTPKVGSAD
jgi:hypothetical protein